MAFKMETPWGERIILQNAYYKIDQITFVFRANQINVTIGMYEDEQARQENIPTIKSETEVIRDEALIAKLDGLDAEGVRKEIYTYIRNLEKYVTAIDVL